MKCINTIIPYGSCTTMKFDMTADMIAIMSPEP
jgi:hypothetical protein